MMRGKIWLHPSERRPCRDYMVEASVSQKVCGVYPSQSMWPCSIGILGDTPRAGRLMHGVSVLPFGAAGREQFRRIVGNMRTIPSYSG